MAVSIRENFNAKAQQRDEAKIFIKLIQKTLRLCVPALLL